MVCVVSRKSFFDVTPLATQSSATISSTLLLKSRTPLAKLAPTKPAPKFSRKHALDMPTPTANMVARRVTSFPSFLARLVDTTLRT